MNLSGLRALFYTTSSNECVNHALSWTDFGERLHKTFSLGERVNNDWQLIDYVRDYKPDVVFYIGACAGAALPRISTLKEVRKMAPLINIVSDAADQPWHIALEVYRREECFDLQVAIDGVKSSPVDLVTLTPVSHKAFWGYDGKDIRFGFSGTLGGAMRAEIANSLKWFADLQIRNRAFTDGYQEHIDFIKRCKILLNVSITGSGNGHHIKGRVIEAGLAGCCLLEHAGSPIADWFPSDCYFSYHTPNEAADIVKNLDDATIRETAKRLQHEVHTRFTPEIIYQSMLDRVGLTQ